MIGDMNKNTRAIGMYGAVAGVIFLLGFFMFFRNTGSVEKREVVVRKDTPTAYSESYPSGFQELFRPVIRPLEPAVSYITGVFSGESNNSSEGTKSVDAETEHVSTSRSVLSEEQIFQILWPQSYRDALVMLQDLMIKDNFITSAEKTTAIATDEQIYTVLFKIAEYAKKQGWVGSVDFDQLRTGIQELERTISAERANLRTSGKISNGVLLPGGQNINKTPLTKQSFFSMIIDGLKYSLTVNRANAQIPGVPGWHTTPDCYKDLAPLQPVPGVNLWSFCCNCGLLCTPFGCTFIPDCGPFSAICDIPLGCLNLVCGAWPNAIWDQFTNPFGTGICGCG